MKQNVVNTLIGIALILAACGSPLPATTSTPLPPTASVTPPPTATATPLPVLTAAEAVDCLSGPGDGYERIAHFEAGQQVNVVGRNGDQTYWIVSAPDGRECWLDAQASTLSVAEISALPERTPPPMPTPAPPAAPSEITGSYACEPQYKKVNDQGLYIGSHQPSRMILVGMGIIITITWKDNADDESGYMLRSGGESKALLAPDTTEFKETIVFPGLTANQGFEYSVSAFNYAGSSVEVSVEIAARCR